MKIETLDKKSNYVSGRSSVTQVLEKEQICDLFRSCSVIKYQDYRENMSNLESKVENYAIWRGYKRYTQSAF